MLRLLRFALLLTGSSLLVMLALLSILRQQEAQPPWRVYTSDREGNFEIYRVRLDGSQQVNLTHHPAHDIFLGWGPQGEWLAFASERLQGDNGLYRMNSYGGDVTALEASQVPTMSHLGNVITESPPVDLPLRGWAILLGGVVLLGIGTRTSHLRIT